MALNTSAAINTGVHLKNIAAQSDAFSTRRGRSSHSERDAALLEKNLNYLVRIKKNKAVVTGINLAFTAIPSGLTTGTSSEIIKGLNAIKPLFPKILSKSIHASVDNNDVVQVVIALHYLAYQERHNSYSLRRPAVNVLSEIFSQRGWSRLAHRKYDVHTLINEPCGWLALADKLAL